ncbi:uncharacterized protein CMU_014820 [Cryptosporidium muris RN66]|uniref:Uncharacterized protein n=1 Tax=Cryptosporidium muris (strain RN66) TaxID=441375 RepID=B6AF39_CRYMR|nr:uncharacterized protein CMU_014820 [Cryptosporidium muris RN66]EEA06806.1 hypothetical protein CMU_014820 [Cryptosporidium muris RN66]|eukprot:XP_002141155.1 hypothetical protein [Cryptosporidium muris RN66]
MTFKLVNSFILIVLTIIYSQEKGAVLGRCPTLESEVKLSSPNSPLPKEILTDQQVTPVSPLSEDVIFPTEESSREAEEVLEGSEVLSPVVGIEVSPTPIETLYPCVDPDCLELTTSQVSVKDLVRYYEVMGSELRNISTEAITRDNVAKLVDLFESGQHDIVEILESPTLTALRNGEFTNNKEEEEHVDEIVIEPPTKDKVGELVKYFEELAVQDDLTSNKSEYFVARIIDLIEETKEEELAQVQVPREMVLRLASAWDNLAHRDTKVLSPIALEMGYTFNDLCRDKLAKCMELYLDQQPVVESAYPPIVSPLKTVSEVVVTRKGGFQVTAPNKQEAISAVISNANAATGRNFQPEDVEVKRVFRGSYLDTDE